MDAVPCAADSFQSEPFDDALFPWLQDLSRSEMGELSGPSVEPVDLLGGNLDLTLELPQISNFLESTFPNLDGSRQHES